MRERPASGVERIITMGAVGWVDPGPLVEALALGPSSGRDPPPGPPGQLRGQLVGADRAGVGRDAPVAGDREHIADLLGLALGAQAGVGAVDLVAGQPPRRGARA